MAVLCCHACGHASTYTRFSGNTNSMSYKIGWQPSRTVAGSRHTRFERGSEPSVSAELHSQWLPRISVSISLSQQFRRYIDSNFHQTQWDTLKDEVSTFCRLKSARSGSSYVDQTARSYNRQRFSAAQFFFFRKNLNV
jgi:hypothetical protein